jgi:iron complex outermembrane receptor protein
VIAAARYGGQWADGAYYRVFGKYSDQDSELHPAGSSADDWRLGHVGLRSDWAASPADAVTFQGDFYHGNIGLVVPSVIATGRPGPRGSLRVGVSGGNALARWQHTFEQSSDVQVRLYYDRTHRNDPSFVDDLGTLDLELQHRFAQAFHQQITWGLNYRSMDDRNEGKGILSLVPSSSHDTLYSGFVQDQISLPREIRVTLGTKLEHNDFSGFEVQPSFRVAWQATGAQTIWAAASRAVRVPTRLERDVDIAVSDPTGNPVVRLLGNKSFRAEQVLGFELGYRWQVSPVLFLDLASFYDRYSGLASLELGTPFIDPNTGQTVVAIVNRNLTDGRAKGFEALVTYSALTYWRLSLTYSYLDMSLEPNGQDLNHGRLAEGATPRSQVGLRSHLDLPRGLELDAQFRALSALSSLPQITSGEGIAGYQELDLRLGWRVGGGVTLSLDGRNLLHGHHVEFGAPGQRSAIRRSIYGKVAWQF